MLDTLVSYYCNYGSVIVAGDLNASCRTKDRLHSNHCKSDELQKFVKRHDLLFSGGKIKHTGPDYTFITKKTMIDYFLVNKSVLRQLRSCEILDEGSISSTSDHLPIIVELLIDNNPHRIMNSYSKFPAWHKINDEHIRNYQEPMDVPIELLTDRINSDNVDVDTVNTEIESILHAAADSVIPKCVFNPYTKPYWTPDVKKAHQTERSMRKRWLADGRPRGMSHESYKHYKKAKYEFRNVQNAAYEQYIQKCYDDINEAAECDIRLFWKLVKRCKPSTSRIYPEIIHNGDTCNDPESIANAFMDYFSNICTTDNTDTFDTSKKQFIDSAYSEILNTCCNSNENLPGGVIKESEVRDIVKSLMRKKASGHDKIQNEHLIYGGEVLIRCLTSFFNLIVKKGRVPYDWKFGLLVPLFKGNNKPKTSPDSYRPITLLPSTDYILKEKIADENGRYLILTVEIDNTDFVFVNYYAPTKNFENEQIVYIEKIKVLLNERLDQNLVLGGDFNTILNPFLDKMGGSKYNTPAKYTSKLEDFIEEFELCDIWRTQNVDSRLYTWRQRTPLIQCRLDFWLISNFLSSSVTKTSIVPSIKSDHSLIKLTLSGENFSERGPGFWKFNSGLLTDKDYVDIVKNTLSECDEKYHNLENKNLKWDTMKSEIRGATVKYSKYKNMKLRERESNLKKRQDEIHKNLSRTYLDKDINTLLIELDIVKDDLEQIVNNQTRGLLYDHTPSTAKAMKEIQNISYH
ncbi:unnamed protein product [Mytilus edulis]|uniref:Endonuclease/exonuclease/phosphatase domain-containing protein n=1 Tax=Mytilus edulis TaxID=6550 RepID=A0A8S3UX24_MYTED|nr:unnamed protein product [Mytilus edulis]